MRAVVWYHLLALTPIEHKKSGSQLADLATLMRYPVFVREHSTHSLDSSTNGIQEMAAETPTLVDAFLMTNALLGSQLN